MRCAGCGAGIYDKVHRDLRSFVAESVCWKCQAARRARRDDAVPAELLGFA